MGGALPAMSVSRRCFDNTHNAGGDTPFKAHLLAPQFQVPELIQAGVSCFKIEGEQNMFFYTSTPAAILTCGGLVVFCHLHVACNARLLILSSPNRWFA